MKDTGNEKLSLFESETEENDINTIECAALDGIQAKKIVVEATFTKGLPGFSVVGLASNDIQESKERVKAALQTNGFKFPPLKITINLSPSDQRKSGTHFDLPIAVLIAMNKTGFDSRGTFVFGELGLDGKVKSSSLLFPTIMSLKEQNMIERAIVPYEAMGHLSHIPGIAFVPVKTLSEAISVMRELGEESGSSFTPSFSSSKVEHKAGVSYYISDYPEDFGDIKGQEIAKRAALIAAAGMHNFLMEGSPGCGKSMIAKRLKYILPPMQEREILSVAKHRFLDGKEPDFLPIRPFRSPHHTSTSASIFGGGTANAKIGEVALANCGILFFDELPHFSKNVLEALREPMQDRKVHISRVHSKIEYDSDFMFVAAMNPCPCGNMLSQTKSCRCSEMEIKRYRNRLSDPFLDRIDLFVTMQEVSPADKKGISSRDLHKSVIEAYRRQMDRGQSDLNGKMSEKEIDLYCPLSTDAEEILQKAVSRFSLSHRSIMSIKKVSRTIADLDDSEQIERKHLLEALSYRKRK